MGLPLPLLLVIRIINATEKAQIAAKIMAFKNTDFSDYLVLTDEQSAQLRLFLAKMKNLVLKG